MKNLYFLAGLPRSGSTLLGSILSQHPKIQSTPTSPLADLLCHIDFGFSKANIHYTYDKNNIQYNTYKSVLENFYNHIEKPCILDKHRAWCDNVPSIKKFLNQKPKIIATNRRISEILSSYIILLEKNLLEKNQTDNFIDNHLRKEKKSLTTNNRIECLWKNYISETYSTVIYGIHNHAENIHIVNYSDLIENPNQTTSKIYEFLEIEDCKHNFSNIVNSCSEDKDSAWGMEDLHKIRPKLGKTSPPPEEIIGEENVKLYDKFNI